MLTTILDQVSKLIGTTYLISGFLPWLVFCIANATTAAAIIGPKSVLHFWQEQTAGSDLATGVASLCGLLILVIGAYVLVSLNGLFKRLLEGRYMGLPFGPFLQWKRNRKRSDNDKLQREIQTAVNEWAQVNVFLNKVKSTLQMKYKEGIKNNTDKIASAEVLEQHKAKLTISGQQVDMSALESCFDELSKLYEIFNPQKYERFQIELIMRIEQLLKEKLASLTALEESREKSFASLAIIAPTDYGNVLAAANQYVADRYGIESIVFWSRLQKVIPSEFMSIVQDAKTVMDSMTALTLLATVYSVLWFFFLPHLVASRTLLIGLPLAGLVSAGLFYKAAVEASYSFGELLRSSFDLFRHALLKELGLNQPPNLKAEKELWLKLSRFVLYNQHSDIEFAVSGLGPAANSSVPQVK